MNCFFREYHEALFNSKKPYQYVGGELLSHNKSFEDAKVRFAVAFPDKYEIGISNLGVRLLYELINKEENYMCDRVYAPETDFQPTPLYALESKVPIIPVWTNGKYMKKERAKVVIGEKIYLHEMYDYTKSEKENLDYLCNYVKNYIISLGDVLNEKK